MRWVLLERKESPELAETKDLRVFREFKVLGVLLVSRGVMDPKENKVPTDLSGTLVQLVCKENKEFRVIKAILDQRAPRESMETLVLQVKEENRALMVLMGRTEIRGHWAQLAAVVHRVRWVSAVIRDPMVLWVQLDQGDREDPPDQWGQLAILVIPEQKGLLDARGLQDQPGKQATQALKAIRVWLEQQVPWVRKEQQEKMESLAKLVLQAR